MLREDAPVEAFSDQDSSVDSRMRRTAWNALFIVLEQVSPAALQAA